MVPVLYAETFDKMLDISAVLITVMVTLGVILNFFVAIVLIYSWKKLKLLNLILLSLTTNDLIQSSCGYSYMLVAYLSKGRVDNIGVCNAQAAIVTCTSLTAISHLVAISIEQSIAITCAQNPQHGYAKSKVYSLVFIVPCWLNGIAWALFPLVGWSKYIKKQYWCSIDLQHRTVSVISYNICLTIFCFVLPVVLIAVFHFKIVTCIQEMVKNAKLSNGASSTMVRRTQIETKKKIVVTCVMIFVFIVAWTPYAIGVIMQIFWNSASDTYLYISALFGKSSVCYNPLIYAIIYKDFRRKARVMLKRLLNFRSLASPSKSSSSRIIIPNKDYINSFTL